MASGDVGVETVADERVIKNKYSKLALAGVSIHHQTVIVGSCGA